MDLIVGATGFLGGEICRRLAAMPRRLRALVRSTSDPAKVEELGNNGIETVIGDLKQPETLEAACHRVTTVISTASSTLSRGAGDSIDSVDRAGQLNLLAAAKAAGVEHFIYLSFPPTKLSFPLQDAKRAVEAAIRDSGIASYTILQPTQFWELWFSEALGFDLKAGKVRVFGDGLGRSSSLSLFDVGSAVVASLDNPAVHNKTLVLGGPEVLTQMDMVRRFEEVIGDRLELEHVPLEALQLQYETAPDPLSKSLAAMMLLAATGEWEIEVQDTLEAIPIELTSVDAFIRASLHRSGAGLTPAQ